MIQYYVIDLALTVETFLNLSAEQTMWSKHKHITVFIFALNAIGMTIDRIFIELEMSAVSLNMDSTNHFLFLSSFVFKLHVALMIG